jgi:23S rRNA pseudouridine1911/1915/1917 synthase
MRLFNFGRNRMSRNEIEIIYRDEDIIVLNKPTDISVTKDRSGQAELKDLLAEQLGKATADKLRLVHRLDKETSGVMILALNADAQSRFSQYFERRLVKKTYLALASGAATSKEGVISANLIQDSRNPNMMRITSKGGKISETHWKLLADFGTIALLAVSPVTGRTHQIRLHLPSIGLPLTVDPLYGSSKPLFLSDIKRGYRIGKGETEKPLMDRLTLHAYQLEFKNPEAGKPDCFIAGLDKKFASALKMLAKHNPKGVDSFLNPEDLAKIISGQKLELP